jgi:hypothetical protein
MALGAQSPYIKSGSRPFLTEADERGTRSQGPETFLAPLFAGGDFVVAAGSRGLGAARQSRPLPPDYSLKGARGFLYAALPKSLVLPLPPLGGSMYRGCTAPLTPYFPGQKLSVATPRLVLLKFTLRAYGAYFEHCT